MHDEWNLEEAIAWVVWRDLRVVESLQNDSLSATYMYPPDKEGYGTRRFDNKLIPRQGKQEDLLQALREGHIKARGRKSGEGDRVAISSEQWRDLTLNVSVYNGTRAIPEDGIGKGTIWDDVKLSVREVKGYFPTLGDKQKVKTKSSGDGAIDDDAMLAQIKELREKSAHNGKRLSVRAAAKEVVSQSGGGTYASAAIDRLRRKYRVRYS